jgi:hypothetical protein
MCLRLPGLQGFVLVKVSSLRFAVLVYGRLLLLFQWFNQFREVQRGILDLLFLRLVRFHHDDLN